MDTGPKAKSALVEVLFSLKMTPGSYLVVLYSIQKIQKNLSDAISSR